MPPREVKPAVLLVKRGAGAAAAPAAATHAGGASRAASAACRDPYGGPGYQRGAALRPPGRRLFEGVADEAATRLAGALGTGGGGGGGKRIYDPIKR